MSSDSEDSYSDCDFAPVDAGSSDCVPSKVSNLKKGGYISMRRRPSKITQISISNTGKHGRAKAAITAVDIFTDDKYQAIYPCAATVQVPIVEKFEYQVYGVDERNNTFSLIDDKNQIREDIPLPDDDLGKSISTAFETGDTVDISMYCAMGEEKIYQMRRRK